MKKWNGTQLPNWTNVEEAFKELDRKEFNFFAQALGAYRKALVKEGFTRREAQRLVETYAKFIYDMSLEEFLTEKRIEEAQAYTEGQNKKVDDDDDDLLS